MFLKRLLTLEAVVTLVLSLFAVAAYSGDVRSAPGAHESHQRPGQDRSAVAMITINVELTDTGFVPESVRIPVGREIQLVVRNRGAREHHYHIVGLQPTDLLWLSKEDPADTPPDVHAAHHGAELVPYHICKSGICPAGIAVHAHAAPGDIDVIIFTATKTGTFVVRCPLHPELKGKVVVF